jgi:TRAP-type mannitol/chloroaromatic compound transport system permease small subunit
MEGLKKFMTAVEKTNIFIGKMMVGVTLLAVSVITFEVLMRYFFNRPTNWGHELMTLLFGIQYAMAAGYAHYYRAHVFTAVFFFGFTLVLLWTCWDFYWSSQTMLAGAEIFGVVISGERSLTDWAPAYYPVKFMMPLGAFMLLLQGIVWLIRDIHIAITGKEMA